MDNINSLMAVVQRHYADKWKIKNVDTVDVRYNITEPCFTASCAQNAYSPTETYTTRLARLIQNLREGSRWY